MYLENLVYHCFRQLWLVLGVKLMEINSNWFSGYLLLYNIILCLPKKMLEHQNTPNHSPSHSTFPPKLQKNLTPSFGCCSAKKGIKFRWISPISLFYVSCLWICGWKSHKDSNPPRWFCKKHLLVENDVPSGKLTTRWLEYPHFYIGNTSSINQSGSIFQQSLC